MTLKDRLYETIHRSNKPLKAIAEEIGMSENYLARAALPDLEESDTGSGCRFPLKKLIPLVRSTGDFGVLDFVERSLGRVAVKLPDVKGGSLRDICRLSLRAVSEFGDMMREVEKSVADQVVTADEMARVREEGYHTIEAVLTLINAMESKSG